VDMGVLRGGFVPRCEMGFCPSNKLCKDMVELCDTTMSGA